MLELPTPAHLRIATAAHLSRYFAKRADLFEFYRRMRGVGAKPLAFDDGHVLYHSWLPGFIAVDTPTAQAIRAWIDGGAFPALPADVVARLATAGWCNAPMAVDLDQLVEKAFTVFPAIQNPVELRRFLDEVAALRPRTAIEIGTAGGGLLYCISQLAAEDALLVSIDVPGGLYGGGQDDEECALFGTFLGARQRLEFIRDRSFHLSTKLDLRKLLGQRKADLLVIDGDHSYAGVRSDFEMYREFVAPGGIIALHDITMFPDTWGRGFDVGVVWREIAAEHRTREIVDRAAPMLPIPDQTETHRGLPALGFGLVLA